MKIRIAMVATAASLLFTSSASAAVNVLWFDSTPEYGGQAPNALRKEMSDYLTAFGGGGVFNSSYVGSETAGTLATTLGAGSYDVVVFDATSFSSKFNAADITAVRSFYADNNRNLLLDGNLYVRSADINLASDFPGPNGSTGGLTVNEVWSLASRGGGIMIGTDHVGYQVDANQILNAIIPLASFSGVIDPSPDGAFTGTELISVKSNVAPADLLTHYSSLVTQGIAPTGDFVDFQGNAITLYSQLNIAEDVGGPRNSFISTSFAPGGGSVIITDPNAGGGVGLVPEPATWMMMILGFGCAGSLLRRRGGASRRAWGTSVA